MHKRLLIACFCILGGVVASLVWKTVHDLRPVPASLDVQNSEIRKPQVTDRYGRLLSVTYLNRWNINPKPLHEFPELIRAAFVESEDRRFYSHCGVDWLARGHALVQNVLSLRTVRGASTITEQAVRMLNPRPRTVWSRWMEGIEAMRLENRFSKSEILEFYLGQVPYSHQRRGVADAALFYFDRDLETLNVRETLALAVLVRAPSHFDLKRSTNGEKEEKAASRPELKKSASKAMDKGIARLAVHMRERGLLSDDLFRAALDGKFEFSNSDRIIEATHFVQQVFKTAGPEALSANGRLSSTLDGDLQKKVRRILETRLESLKDSDVRNGAVLVCDNATGEVLAWVSGNLAGAESGWWLDAVSVPRQPGSTLKPFLYALAIEMGWTPATMIDDFPLAQPVRSGLHSFHNYSRTFYGPLRLREALGNSLNTPAVRTIQFTGTARFLEWLHLLGVTGLKQSADFYGQGLALGDGEVSLFELVQAYSVLARKGEFRPLTVLPETGSLRPWAGPRALSDRWSSGPDTVRDATYAPLNRIMSEETASIIADILSDPQARKLEFGEGHLLRFPVQTAIKTGTSTDHRDCWAVGFSSRYTVGVWMGNFEHRPTNGITGAIGPALVLRSVFAELNRYTESGPLPVSSGLEVVRICASTGLVAGPGCPGINELFPRERAPVEMCSLHSGGKPGNAGQYPNEAHNNSAASAGAQRTGGDTPDYNHGRIYQTGGAAGFENPTALQHENLAGHRPERAEDEGAASGQISWEDGNAGRIDQGGSPEKRRVSPFPVDEDVGPKGGALSGDGATEHDAALEVPSSLENDAHADDDVSRIASRKGTASDPPDHAGSHGGSPGGDRLRLIQPVPGLEIAFDPRIPPDLQAFAFKLPKHTSASRVEWVVDGEVAGQSKGNKYLWQVSRGNHSVRARVWRTGETNPMETPEVNFVVR